MGTCKLYTVTASGLRKSEVHYQLAVFREWISFSRSLPSHPAGMLMDEVLSETLVPYLPRTRSYPKGLDFASYKSWLQRMTSVPEFSFPPFDGSQLHPREPHYSTEGSQPSNVQTLGSESFKMIRPQNFESTKSNALLEDIGQDEEASRFSMDAIFFCQRTRLLATSSRYLCKALVEVQIGDYVVLISGVRMPLIVRKEGETYRLKGPCWAEVITKGEKWPSDERELVEIVLT